MSKKYNIAYPGTPGAIPLTYATAETLPDARRLAVRLTRERRDLRGQDVRIERPDGTLVEYAGVGS